MRMSLDGAQPIKPAFLPTANTRNANTNGIRKHFEQTSDYRREVQLPRMNSNMEMEHRPKRMANKPARYQTTSSDEEPRKRLKVAPGSIVEDITDLRATLEGVDDEVLSNNYRQHEHTNTYTPLDTYSPYTSTYTPSNINIYSPHTPPNTYRPPPTAYAPPTQSFHIPDAVESRPEPRMQQGTEPTNLQIRDLYTKIGNLESMVTKTHSLLEKVAKQQQHLLHQHHGIPSKPAFLPISSLARMTEFQNIDEDSYREVVNYLEYVGGFNLKEAVTLSFKETVSDCLLTSYSWLGREDNNLALCETRIVHAIHDAVLQNKHFPRPSRKDVAEHLKAALRTAKERVRSKRRGPRNPQHETVDNFWTAKEQSR
ncbi:uncharacterized protein LOC117611082 [Osmia lignaria lignaria]|uniref:uncharacterized protein LOC117611082 n=1 Tax=Osmia lignaria lignaria TaxID=1437193 RepID=UPI00402B88F1